jgi:LemA protein
MGILTWSLVFLVIALVYLAITYNRLVVMGQNVKESWSGVETEMRRRFDLIPNIVETVKGYASHERETLEAVIQARNNATANLGSPEALANSQNVLTGALSKLFALSEAYPQLKANESFNQLQSELAETETRISQARRFYNANVRDYNSTLGSFPNVLFANSMGFSPKAYFGIDDPAALEPVQVNFEAAPSQARPQSISLKSPTSLEQKDS